MSILRQALAAAAREATAVALEHAARAIREYSATEKPGTSPMQGKPPMLRPDATRRTVRFEDVYPKG